MNAKTLFSQLNKDYLELHVLKEDLFWSTYMGTSDQHDESATAESNLTSFVSDPKQAVKVRQALAELDESSEANKQLIHGLKGWLALFEANSIESEAGQSMMSDLIKMESDLFSARQNHTLYFEDEHGTKQEASLPSLASCISANKSESARKSAHDSLLGLEQWVLNNGFIELIKARNVFARSQGYRNFFDYKVNKTEQMTPEQLFTILDDFEERTRQSNLDSLQNLENKLGSSALTGFNFNYSWSGDTAAALDPYFSFKYSLRRWVESFGRLNIEYSEAELTLDLLDRKGKYQNGFCHGPMPSHFNDESWVPAKVNFTSNAKPDQVGSGYSGINTLFHEGGHAAHFANVKQNSPCFAQEFAPTSMAYAETQSMFCDSLLEDADWLKTYALNEDGESVPNELIKETIFARQPFMAYQERSILVVPYFEWALYSLEDEALTPENITELARSKEKSILGLACSPRPLLAIPHLLSQESACSYQGYLLAHMAVYQTRAYFENKFGYLTDNAKIGPLLAEYYWKQGNAIDHNQTLVDLTGEGFNAEYLARECSLTSEQAWEYALNQINSSNTRTQVEPNKLNAKVRIVDGAFEICNNQISDNDMCDKFEAYITQHYS